MIKKQTR